MYTFRISDAIKAELGRRLDRSIEIEVRLVAPEAADVWSEDLITAPARERLAAFRRQRALARGLTASQPHPHSEQGAKA